MAVALGEVEAAVKAGVTAAALFSHVPFGRVKTKIYVEKKTAVNYSKLEILLWI